MTAADLVTSAPSREPTRYSLTTRIVVCWFATRRSSR